MLTQQEIKNTYFTNGRYDAYKSEKRRTEIKHQVSSKRYGILTRVRKGYNTVITANPVEARQAIKALEDCNKLINKIFK